MSCTKRVPTSTLFGGSLVLLRLLSERDYRSFVSPVALAVAAACCRARSRSRRITTHNANICQLSFAANKHCLNNAYIAAAFVCSLMWTQTPVASSYSGVKINLGSNLCGPRLWNRHATEAPCSHMC